MNRRHWKQHYTPGAEFVFARRLRMGDDPNKPFVFPGEKLSPEMRTKLGEHRVRNWFENGTLEIADFKSPEPQRELALRALVEENETTLATVKESERVNIVNVPVINVINVTNVADDQAADQALIHVLAENADRINQVIATKEEAPKPARKKRAKKKASKKKASKKKLAAVAEPDPED